MDININFNVNSKKFTINGILILILLVATFLRIYKIGFQDAWLDEIHTLKESDPSLSFSEFHQIIMLREGIPHFYFLTVRFFSEIFGSSIVVARMVSAVAGVLSVYFIYKLGKELFTKNTGYIAAALLTVNLTHIEYSQEARSYSILILFTIVSFYRLILFLKETNLKNALYLGFFAGMITHAHPIGLVYVAALYLILFFALIAIEGKDKKTALFKFSFISGIMTLLVFSPVYQIVAKVSDIQSFWVPAPTYENIKQLFVDLSGKSEMLLYAVILAAIYYFTCVVMAFTKKSKTKLLENKIFISFSVLFIWFTVAVLIIILKSYSGTSLILVRYFIGVLPAIMLFLAMGIALIGNKILKGVALTIILGFMIFKIFSLVNYYTTVTKAQFKTVCEEVMTNNTNNNKVVSSWGWLLSYYLDKDNKIKNVYEISLASYLEQVKNNAIDQETFWYIDGNYRPYNISPELQDFVAKNYTVTKTIEYNDAWAKCFVSKKIIPTDQITIDLARFSNAQYDGSGKLMFFQNSKSSYPPFNLAQGTYEISIIGNSLPNPPINNENAKMNIYINNAIFKTVSLSEKNQSETKLLYKQDSPGNIIFELEFINDFSDKTKDRNLQISKIKFQKSK